MYKRYIKSIDIYDKLFRQMNKINTSVNNIYNVLLLKDIMTC